MLVKLTYVVISTLIPILCVTVANSADGEQPSAEVRSASEVQFPKTSAIYLLRIPRQQNKVPQLNGSHYIGGNPTPVRSSRETRPRGWLRNALPRQATTDVVLVTDVKVNTTDKGIELILVTQNSYKLQVKGRVEGNSYIADIPNAQLQLTSGESFQQLKPAAGIAEVTVASQDANTLRVTVTGEALAPTVNLFDSTQEGLVFGVSTAASIAQQPTTTPQQQPQTEQNQPPIELEVTAPPDTNYQVPNTSVGTKTDTPLRDIPQSIQVIPRQVIEDRRAIRIQEALRTVGVLPSGFSSRVLDNFTLRGFATTNILRNGLRYPIGARNLTAETTNLERIEVLRGPASVLYGQNSPGGIINLVTKQPLSDPYYFVDFGIGSYESYRPSIDFSGPLNSDKNFLYRLSASYLNSKDFIDFVTNERYFVAPVLTWRISDNTKLTLDTQYQDTLVTGDQAGGLPLVGTVKRNPLGEVSRRRNLGDPSDYIYRRSLRISYNLEHRLSNNWTLNNAFQFGTLTSWERSITPDTLLNDNRTVTRGGLVYFEPFRDTAYYLDSNVAGRFKTGSFQHELLVGFDLFRDITRIRNAAFTSARSIDLFNPVYGNTPIGSNTFVFKNKTRDDALGIYAQDQIALTNNLKLLLGGRFDYIENENNNFVTNRTTFQSDQAFSPRLGVIYQPIEPVSLYASYSRSFDQVIGTDVNSNSFKPRRGTQYEIGVKTDWLNKKLSANLALYQLTYTNVLTTNPDNTRFQIQTGEQRTRGIELSVAGEILPGWKVIGLYAYTDGRVSSDNRFRVGNILTDTPENSVSLWTTYEIQKGNWRGLGFGLGGFYVGERQGDLANTYQLPSYFRTDAAIYYRKNNLRLGLNLQNIFDIKYAENSRGITRVFLGEPFTATFSVGWEF